MKSDPSGVDFEFDCGTGDHRRAKPFLDLLNGIYGLAIRLVAQAVQARWATPRVSSATVSGSSRYVRVREICPIQIPDAPCSGGRSSERLAGTLPLPRGSGRRDPSHPRLGLARGDSQRV